MKEAVSYFGVPILFLAFAAFFVLLFVVIHRVLKEVSFFKGATAVIVALCVSLLSIIGLSQLSAGGGGLWEVNNNEDRTGGILEFILIPYAALALAILLLLLLSFIAKLLRGERVKKYSEEARRGETERRHPREKVSETHGKSDEETRIRK